MGYFHWAGGTARPTLDVSVQHFLDFGFAYRSDSLFHHLTALEQKQSGDTTDVIPHGRVSIRIDIELTDSNESHARASLKEMCERLLANTIIEKYEIELKP